jgi:hypothetical protein
MIEMAIPGLPFASTETSISAEKNGGLSARNGALSNAAPRVGTEPIAARGRRTRAAIRHKYHGRRHNTLTER